MVLDQRTGFYLDPADTQSYLAVNGDNLQSIEFRLVGGVSITLELANSFMGGP